MKAPERGADAKEECERWFREYGQVFKRKAYKLAKPDKHLAEEIAAEAVMKVFRAWLIDSRWTSNETPSVNYCQTVVDNVWRDHLRKQYAQKTPNIDFGKDIESLNISDSRMSEEDAHDLRILVDSLPETEREITNLIYFYGHTIINSGERLGVTRSMAYKAHTSALALLNRMLTEGEV